MIPATATAPAPVPSPARKLLVLGLLLTALSYSAALRFEFVYDDTPQIVENQLLRSWSSAPHFFTHHLWWQFAPEAKGNFYRPGFLLWLLVNYQLFGLHPWAWHAGTIVVHLLATFLVFALARRLLQDEMAAAVAALVFGLHPAHIESVAWISGVTDPLMCVPLLAALLCWINFRGLRAGPLRSDHAAESNSWLWAAAALFCAALSLLAKETAVVLPLLVALCEFWHPQLTPLHERTRRALASAAPFLLLDAIYLGIRVLILHVVIGQVTVVPLSWVIATAPSLLWFYLQHLLWPVGLSAFYETPYVTSARSAQFWLPLLGLCALAGAAWGLVRTNARTLVLAACWIFIGLLPALEIRAFQFGELAHDRYLYLPSVGFCMLIGYAVARLPGGQRQFFGYPARVTATTLGLVAALGAAAAAQSTYWADNVLLYAHAASVAPSNPHALQPLAYEMLRQQRLDEAITLLERCTLLVPQDWKAQFLLAHACYRKQRYQESDQHFRLAAAIDPKSAATHYFFGLTLQAEGRDREAEAELRHAIALEPAAQGFHLALAELLAARGDARGARNELQAELRVDPQSTQARNELRTLNKQ